MGAIHREDHKLLLVLIQAADVNARVVRLAVPRLPEWVHKSRQASLALRIPIYRPEGDPLLRTLSQRTEDEADERKSHGRRGEAACRVGYPVVDFLEKVAPRRCGRRRCLRVRMRFIHSSPRGSRRNQGCGSGIALRWRPCGLAAPSLDVS